MKQVIREALEKREQELMANEHVTMTSEQFAQLIEALKAPRMNPLEEAEYKKRVAADERRSKMMVELGKVEEEAERRKRDGCSHCRWPAGTGTRAGHAAPRGQGEWVTGGQIHTDGSATVICKRCSTTWRFMPSPQETQFYLDAGFEGCPPPAPERIVAV